MRAGFPGRMGPPTAQHPFVDPTSISGLIGWYTTRDASTITKDGSNVVSAWNDKSGRGYHLIQNTAANRPTWVDAQQNGLPVISCVDTTVNGTSGYLISATTASTTTSTVFMVIKRSALIGVNDGILGGPAGNIYNNTVLEWTITGTNNGTTALRGADLPILNQYMIMSWRRSANANHAEVRENGAIIKQAAHTGGAVTASALRIGRDGNNNMSTTSYGELVVYDNYLSDAQMLAMEDYLNGYWNCYTNFAGRRSLRRGSQRYATANNLIDISGITFKKGALLWGQSNAAGVAPIASLSATLQAAITNGYIEDPTTFAFATLQANVNNQPNQNGQPWFGPEISLVYDMATDFGTAYLVKSATGGTSLATYWRPDSAAVSNLYVGFTDKIDGACYKLGFEQGIEILFVVGVWWQGENDANATDAPNYQASEVYMINTLRSDTNLLLQDLPIVVPSVNNTTYSVYHAQVNAAKDYNATILANYYRVPGWTTGQNLDSQHANAVVQVAVGNAAALVAGCTTQIAG